MIFKFLNPTSLQESQFEAPFPLQVKQLIWQDNYVHKGDFPSSKYPEGQVHFPLLKVLLSSERQDKQFELAGPLQLKQL